MKLTRQTHRRRRHLHLRKKIEGTASKPRISVFRSNRYLFVQAVDDEQNKVLSALSEKKVALEKGQKPIDRAGKMGGMFGDMLKKKKVKTAVFDRSGYAYHGRVMQLADGIRKSGIKF